MSSMPALDMEDRHFEDNTSVELSENLPGTTLLIQNDSDIVLSPRPTTSPNDPLNWSLQRKIWHGLLVCYIAGLTAATSNDASSAQFGENRDLGISYNTMNTGSGLLFLGIGWGTLIISPAAWLWGRRSSYLFCIACGLFGSIWFGVTSTARDAVWCQLLTGISESCAEANVQLSLSDLFFEHQRGSFIGVYVLATSVGTFLGPLIASFIAGGPLGWRWIGWMSVVISFLTLCVLFFGLEETMFDRSLDGPQAPTIPSNISDTSATINGPEPSQNPVMAHKEFSSNELLNGASLAQEKPKSYRQRIALVTPAPNLVGWGFKQYISRLFHTLRVFLFPAVIWSGIQWGAQDAWLTFYLTVDDNNWSEPPWNYSDVGVGLMNLPCLIGAIIGCFYGGCLSDRFMVFLAKRNKGVTEPEHRLWLLLPLAIINPLGMLLFGIGTGRHWKWPVPYIGLGFIGFGWGCTGDLSMSYLMDAYPEMVLEGMVGVSVINNNLACIFTFVADKWLDAQGVEGTFIVIAVLDFVFVMTTLPMMVWGKQCRRWTKKKYEDFVERRSSL